MTEMSQRKNKPSSWHCCNDNKLLQWQQTSECRYSVEQISVNQSP